MAILEQFKPEKSEWEILLGAPFHRIITDTFSINANYLISNSGIVNPNSQISSNAYNTISMYYSKDLIILGSNSDIGFASLVSYKSYDFLFNGTTDSFRRLQFEGGKQSLRIIGLAMTKTTTLALQHLVMIMIKISFI